MAIDEQDQGGPEKPPPPSAGPKPARPEPTGPDLAGESPAPPNPAPPEARSGRPTPVRESLASSSDEDAPSDSPRPFAVGDVSWIARVSGKSLTGRDSDAGAPLLQVTFHLADDPRTPVRELIFVGTTLDVYGDAELVHLLDRSRPYRKPEAPSRPPRRQHRRPRRD